VIPALLCAQAQAQWKAAFDNARGMIGIFHHPLIPDGVAYMMDMDWINHGKRTSGNECYVDIQRLGTTRTE
jgi:hypothetical protein